MADPITRELSLGRLALKYYYHVEREKRRERARLIANALKNAIFEMALDTFANQGLILDRVTSWDLRNG